MGALPRSVGPPGRRLPSRTAAERPDFSTSRPSRTKAHRSGIAPCRAPPLVMPLAAKAREAFGPSIPADLPNASRPSRAPSSRRPPSPRQRARAPWRHLRSPHHANARLAGAPSARTGGGASRTSASIRRHRAPATSSSVRFGRWRDPLPGPIEQEAGRCLARTRAVPQHAAVSDTRGASEASPGRLFDTEAKPPSFEAGCERATYGRSGGCIPPSVKTRMPTIAIEKNAEWKALHSYSMDPAADSRRYGSP